MAKLGKKKTYHPSPWMDVKKKERAAPKKKKSYESCSFPEPSNLS